jgi:hypothetical protein
MRLRITTAGSLAAAVMFTGVAAAEAHTFTVVNEFSRGPGSLARTIDKADEKPGRDTIRFGRKVRAVDVERRLTIHDPVRLLGRGKGRPALVGPVGGSRILFRKSGPQRSSIAYLRLERVGLRTRGEGAALDVRSTVLDGGGTASGMGIHATRSRLRVITSRVSGFGLSGLFVGNAKVDRSTVARNGYAGIHSFGRRVHVRASTVSGNPVGVVASYTEDVRIDNSTLSGNGDAEFLGAAAVSATDGSNVQISSTTIADTTIPDPTPGTVPAAVWAQFSSRVELVNSIVAETAGRDCSTSSRGEMVFEGGNVLDDADGCTLPGGGQGALVGDPALGPLSDNMGPTHTHAIGPDSAAYGAATAASPRRDQRGVVRDADPDAGSFEAPTQAVKGTG